MIASFLLPQLERWPTTFFYIKAAIAAIPWPARFASSHPLRIFLDARSILLSSGLYPVFSRQGCLISMWLLLSFYILFALTPLLRFTLSCLYKTALLPTKLFAQNTSRSDLAVIIAEIKAQAADRDAKHSLLLQQTFTAFALELRDHSARLDASFAQRSDFVQQSDLVRTSDLVQNSGLAQRSDSPQNPDNAPLDALSKQIHKLEENSRFRSYEHRLLIGENKRKLSHELCTYRGDVMLHINKLSEWLNGELPKHLEAQGSRLYSRLAAYFDLADVHQLKLAEGLEEQIKHYTEQHASVLAGQIYNMAVNVHQTASRFNEWEKEVSSRLLAIEDALHIPQRPPLKEINQPSA
ncbi:hypothetical protein BZA70DRAFT_93967 [Myxozyma melibiosi]|uniref:Uncharacterized protein n=1 Tax=Myxozyma melibiosi TaxID=54550 RepID=A0ABR1EYW4_9ASCO